MAAERVRRSVLAAKAITPGRWAPWRGSTFQPFVTRSQRFWRWKHTLGELCLGTACRIVPKGGLGEFREQAGAFSALPPLFELADHLRIAGGARTSCVAILRSCGGAWSCVLTP